MKEDGGRLGEAMWKSHVEAEARTGFRVDLDLPRGRGWMSEDILVEVRATRPAVIVRRV